MSDDSDDGWYDLRQCPDCRGRGQGCATCDGQGDVTVDGQGNVAA